MPSPSPEALQSCWRVFEATRVPLGARLLAEAERIPELQPLLKTLTPAARAAQEAQNRELQRQAFLEGQWGPYEANLKTQGAGYARMGIGFGTWMPLVTSSRDALRPILAKEDVRTAEAIDWILDHSVRVLAEAYLDEKEETIAQQQEAIRELSTPVLQIRPGIILLPIVGMVDTDRARKLTAALLEAIRAQRARAVVMDITGVPIVDSKVANHLVQTCEAARLMGARVIVTGISAEIAQALVGIGAVLQGVTTVGDLQGGIERAERMLKERLPGPEAGVA